MALPSLVASDQLIRAVWGNAVVQAIRNTIAGKATEAHQLFQSTGVGRGGGVRQAKQR